MSGSITNFLAAYQAGDRDAAQHLWIRYYEQLVRVARTKLRGTSRRMSDEEDVALCAFESFCSALEAGRFPHLADRHGLWRLLVYIAGKKAIDVHRYEARKRRTGQSASGATAVDTPTAIDEVVGSAPSPEFCAMAAESLRELLESLPVEGMLREIAISKMEGYTNAEIAGRMDCSLSTVERKLREIRHRWSFRKDS